MISQPKTPAKDARATATTAGVISPGVIRTGSPIRQTTSPIRYSTNVNAVSRPTTTNVIRYAAPPGASTIQSPPVQRIQASPVQVVQSPVQVVQPPVQVVQPVIQSLPVIVPDKNLEVLPVTEGGFVSTPYPLNFTWVDTGMAAAEQTVDYDLVPVGYNYEVLSERRIDDVNPEYQTQLQTFNSGPVGAAPVQPIDAYNAVPVNAIQPAAPFQQFQPSAPFQQFQPSAPLQQYQPSAPLQQFPPATPILSNPVLQAAGSPVRYSAAPVRYSPSTVKFSPRRF